MEVVTDAIMPGFMKASLLKLILTTALLLLVAATAVCGAPASPFGVAATLETRDGAPAVRFQFTVPPDHALYPSRLAFETGDGRPLAPLSIPGPAAHRDRITGEEKQVYDRSFAAEFNIGAPPPAVLIVRLQGCSNGTSISAEKRVFKVTPTGLIAQTQPPVPANNAAAGLGAINATKSQVSTDGQRVAARDTAGPSGSLLQMFLGGIKQGPGLARAMVAQFRLVGPLAMLFLILLGGIGVKLARYVQPLIPGNLAIIGAGSRAGCRRRGFALGAVCGAGMALVFGVPAVVAVLTGSKFGTHNSHVWSNLIIALAFAVMALAMFDVVNIDFTRFQNNFQTAGTARKSQYVWAFSTGVIAALLAGICVAPVLISVLGRAAHL